MSEVAESTERQESEAPRVPAVLPVLPLDDVVIYPYMMMPLPIGEPASVRLIDSVVNGDKMLALFARRPAAGEQESALYEIGTAAGVLRMLKMPDGSVQVLLQGFARIRRGETVQTEPFQQVEIEVLRDEVATGLEMEALMRSVVETFRKIVALAPNAPDELAITVLNLTDPAKLADFIAANTHISFAERQDLLETLDVRVRLEKLMRFLNRELEILELGSRIQSQMKEQVSKREREFYLREQMKAIQKELGETDERAAELAELRERVEQANLPPEAAKEAERELDRLAKMPPGAAEYTVSRTYLDWLIVLPWSKSTVDNLDIAQAERVLDEDHHDLEKVKARILEYLAVRKLKEDMRGPILCFVGPPGVGKTSLGQSIARALGRKFMRMSLGGVRDEAEIRGHRRTYVGALPGRIIQGLRRVESNNPVMMLDEVDKLGADFRGDPSSALLEVLDPAQNFAFSDHYLDVPFDLSKVMFITTANQLDPVPPALRDRMEVIEIPGYTENDKLQIARHFIVPKQLKEHGIPAEQLAIDDAALMAVIRGYTREAGVRNLEREVGSICRKAARRLAVNGVAQILVGAENLAEFLGLSRFRYEVAEQEDEIGVATGLAVTAVGGDVLFVEAMLVPGHGALILTGSLGEVMQESARAALTYARSRWKVLGVPEDFYERFDIHIHVPAGAIPKDGPSAGVTMTTAVISALTGRPVSKDVAMTGEVTLRGKVLPIGGLKEKVLAAHRAGIRTVILPKDNERDLEDVPADVRAEMRLIPAENVDQVLNHALRPLRRKEKVELVPVP